MDAFIPHATWMRQLPDNAPVVMLSIPGTHNSCCVDGLLGFGQTQNLDLADQLEAGIRFLDIRLAHYRDNLFVHHDVVHMGKSYKDVLHTCAGFLRRNPSETILMAVKDEGRFDSALGRFAPSEILGEYRGDPKNWVIRSSTFEDAFKARTWEHIEDHSLFFNVLPPGGSDGAGRALTSRTMLGEVRGKIVLLRRFAGGRDVGFDCTYWPEDRCFSSGTVPVYHVEDRYRHPGEEEKYRFVTSHLEEARSGDPESLYITFASAVNLKPSRYARTLNPRLNDYLAHSGKGRTGIVVVDYFDEPRELVSNVIATNVTSAHLHTPR